MDELVEGFNFFRFDQGVENFAFVNQKKRRDVADTEFSVETCFGIEITVGKLNLVMLLLSIFHEHRLDSLAVNAPRSADC